MKIPGAVPLTALCLVLTGCSSDGTRVELEGPWATEFETEYRNAPSDFVRDVLRDGAITDSELAEMVQAFRKCLKASSIELKTWRPDGSYNIHFDEELGSAAANDTVTRCSKQVGEDSISSLYHFVRMNPDNQDWTKILVTCLIDAGVVGETYTSSDYLRDSRLQPFPFRDPERDKPLFDQCTADPLGLLQ
jgi:hypothetical protein